MHLLQWNPSGKLSTRLDIEVDINLKLSINFSLYVIVLLSSSSFLIRTEKVIYFSVFSPKHSNWPSNYFASSLIMTWLSYVETLWYTTGISFGVLYLKSQIPWAAPQYFPV